MKAARTRARLGAVGSATALLFAAGIGATDASILDNCNSRGECSSNVTSKKPAKPKVEEKTIPGTKGTPAKKGDSSSSSSSTSSQRQSSSSTAARTRPLTEAEKKARAAFSDMCTVARASGNDPAECSAESEEPRQAQAAQPARPGTPARTVRTVSAREVVERAKAKIKLPKPQMGSAPCTEAGCKGTVGVPTWFWLDGDEWQTRTDSASAGGHTVRVTAKPSKVVWKLGDGQSVTCTGPGTPYDESKGWATSPDCGLKDGYRKAGTYTVTADITYDVTVRGAIDESETVTRSSSESITVREIQSVIN